MKTNNRFCGLLEQMANNCQNLKSIDCRYNVNDPNSDIRQFFSLLKAFPLKRLNLSLSLVSKLDVDGEFEYIDVNQLFSFELFRGLSNISHLSLCFDLRQALLILKESILKDIDINLPKLQYLQIEYGFDTTQEGVTQMAHILSRLSRLETLKLKFKSRVDYKPIEEQITKKCKKKIRKIEIKISNY